jgi:hypothetical protein
MDRCPTCGILHEYDSYDGYCSIECLKFMHEEIVPDGAHVILSKIREYNEDESPELDTIEKVLSYSEYKAQFG